MPEGTTEAKAVDGFAQGFARVIVLANAATEWNNERLRIARTTYDPQKRERAICAADNRLMIQVQTVAHAEKTAVDHRPAVDTAERSAQPELARLEREVVEKAKAWSGEVIAHDFDLWDGEQKLVDAVRALDEFEAQQK